MIRSFRLRLALLSALLSGVVLAAFGLGSWWLVRSIKMERLDSEVRAVVQREVTRSASDTRWSDEEGRLAKELGVRDSRDLLVLVQDHDAAQWYRSAHWPDALDASGLGWPAPALGLLAPAPGFSLFSSAWAQEPPAGRPRRGPGPDGLPPGHRPQHRPGERPFQPPVREPWPDAAVAPAVPVPAVTPVPESAPPVVVVPHLPPAPPRVASVVRTVDGSVWHLGLASTEAAGMAIGVNVRVIDADMKGIRNAFLVALPFALGLIGMGSWLFAGSALRPVRKLTATTRKVTVEGLGQRIDAAGEDHEFAELIEVFNRMLGRLERSFQQAHRFTADAAHELKTPLAIVQGQLERAINQSEGRAVQAALSSVLDEVRRLSVISRKLLLLSQADAGRLTVFREPVDLSKMLEELLEDTRMLAPHLALHADIQPGLLLQADASLLRQVLHNLISNAIKYNVDAGWIRISTTRWAQRMEVVVSNASQGIPVQQRGKIFERFFRADPAHSRHIEGVGLGLSVSREIARAHGGDLSLKSDAAGAVEFSLLLPL